MRMHFTRFRLFLAIGRLSALLPPFRGKNRAALALYRRAGLQEADALVETRLRTPVAYRARLDLRSWLQRLAFVSGGYEAQTVRFLARLQQASPGYLLDVGANIGLIAVPFSILTGSKVAAIEAVPDNAAALRHNIGANGLAQKIDVIPLAVGESPGSVDIQMEGDARSGTGTANILPDGSDYECERIRIEVTTLDDLYSAGRLPTGCGIVKIDTDGYDLKVLSGGKSFITAERPVIFGEFAANCLAWHGQSIEDVRRWAAANRYEAWLHTSSQEFLFSSDILGPFSQDVLLVPTERAQGLSWCAQRRA